MTHLLLFRVRSWSNGMCCMSFYIFIFTDSWSVWLYIYIYKYIYKRHIWNMHVIVSCFELGDVLKHTGPMTLMFYWFLYIYIYIYWYSFILHLMLYVWETRERVRGREMKSESLSEREKERQDSMSMENLSWPESAHIGERPPRLVVG